MMRVTALVFATLLLANTTLRASGPIAFVQVMSATPHPTSTSVALTYTLAQKAGNLNVVVVGWNDTTSTVSRVSDSLGNNYALAIGPTTGTGLRQSIYYAPNIKAGSNTVTVSFNQAAVSVDVRVLEYSGLDPASPLDVKAGAAGSGTSASSGVVTTTSASDLIFGAGMTFSTFTAAGTGFTSRIITSPDGDIAEDKTVSATGSYSATAPNSSSSWVMQMVAFRASGQGSGNPVSGNPAPTVNAISPSSGTANGGSGVTVTGTGFLSGATVTIGGTAATGVTVVSSTTITATTPAHAAGAADVVVRNTDNQTGTLSGGYTYSSGTGVGPIAFVQVMSATPHPTSTSVALTYTLAQKAGNLNVVVVGWNDTTSTVSMVSDSLGNNYALAIGPTTGTGLRQSIYYAPNIKAGSNTVTVSFNQAAVSVDVRVLEYSGLDPASPLDVKAGAAGSGTSASSGVATTTSASDLIFGAGMTFGRFPAAGAGFTSRIITSPDGDIAEDRTVSATGSYSATAPNSSDSWVMQMVAFRASGQGSGNPVSGNPAPTVNGISPSSGTANGGTGVTVTGTGFLSGATVTIGGTAATSVTVVSSTSIKATTPAHAAGAADVVVRNTDNQMGTLSGGYTYTSSTGGGTSPPSPPAGATFFDNFSSGSLDTTKWIPSNWAAPGGGTFVPSYLDFSSGMLRIEVTQTYNSSGGIASVGGELQSKKTLGFGTYEWVIRASSTSSTPTGSGVAVSGQISSGFIFVNNSQTEIDTPEIEGQNPGTLWWTTWTSVTTKQSTSTQAPFAPEQGFHSYKCVWTSSSIMFYVDGALVSTHTGVVPQTPAYGMINHWGTNSTGWGGLATPNITRYMFVRSFSFIPQP